MEVTDITFNIKDLITVVVGVSSFTGFYYALRRSVEEVSNDLDILESKQKIDNEAIMKTLQEHKQDMHISEEHIYGRITEIREEQKTANDKLETKIDVMSANVSKMNTSLAELSGYIRAKR